MRRSRLQRTVAGVAALLLGWVFVGTLAESYLNVREFVTPARAGWATAALILGWCAVNLRARRVPFPWIVFADGEPHPVFIRRLGLHPTAVVAGMIALLWVAVFYPGPRQHLTRRDLERFTDALRSVPQPRGSVRLGCPPADEDACLLAGQLLRAFRAAGWEVHGSGVDRMFLGNPVSGVVLLTREGHPDGSGRLLRWEDVPIERRPPAEPEDEYPQPGKGRWTVLRPGLLGVMRALNGAGVTTRNRVHAGDGLAADMTLIYVGPHSLK
jgi:hypothetical protein